MDQPTHLENEHVALRRIRPGDADGFRAIAFDPEIWRFFTSKVSSEEELDAFMQDSLQADASGARAVFTVVDKASGRIAGSTSFANLSARDGRIEIGWSWLGRDFQRSRVNRSCKFLLMRDAFERQGMLRVELKTDVLNLQARVAMAKIGCVEEGVLRSHTLMHGGRRRDTVYYSLLAGEWPQAKRGAFAAFC